MPLADSEAAEEVLACVAGAVGPGLESFAVSGFSMGTAVAVSAAARHPGRVTALILSSGFAWPNPRLRLAIEVWRSLENRPDLARIQAAYLSLMFGSAKWLDSRTSEEVEEQLKMFAEGMPAGTDEQLQVLEKVDVRADLRKISVPTLVISPTEDLLTTPVHSRELHEGISGSELVSLHCGHSITAERPEEWASTMEGFLARNGV